MNTSSYKKYAALVIRSIYDTLFKMYTNDDILTEINQLRRYYPMLIKDFVNHLYQFSELKPQNSNKAKQMKKYYNKKIYGKLETSRVYSEAIIDFISGMTDRYAIAVFNELLKY